MVNDSMKRVARHSERVESPEQVEGHKLAGKACPIWKTEEDLPDAARAFYSEAARCAAIPLTTLVVAADQIERRLEVWDTRTRKEK
jgi:RNA polymerase I-specific transcription initiation factor RRN7